MHAMALNQDSVTANTIAFCQLIVGTLVLMSKSSGLFL